MNILRFSGRSKQEWNASWRIPLISAIGVGIYAIPNLMLGVLMPDIQAETGWTRLQISSGAGILSVVMVALSPFMGHAIDRFGSRRIALPGLTLFALALAALALAGDSMMSWWIGYSLLAFAALFIKATVWTNAVVSRFEVSRGLAVAITLSGGGIAAAVIPYLTTVLQQNYGWQGAYVGVGAICALVSLPLVWRYFFDAADDQGRSGRSSIKAQRSALPGLSPREALTSRRFIQMALACFLVALAITALGVHFVPMLRGRGVPPLTAAAIASGIGIATIVGRLVTGMLLDKFSGPLVGFCAFSLPVLACAILILDPGASMAFAVAIIIGLAGGAEFDVIAYLTARYFGLRHFGLLFGTMAGLVSFGAGIGPMLGARIFDHYGDYQNLLLIIGPTFALSGLLVGTLGAYPRLSNAAAEDADLEAKPA